MIRIETSMVVTSQKHGRVLTGFISVASTLLYLAKKIGLYPSTSYVVRKDEGPKIKNPSTMRA